MVDGNVHGGKPIQRGAAESSHADTASAPDPPHPLWQCCRVLQCRRRQGEIRRRTFLHQAQIGPDLIVRSLLEESSLRGGQHRPLVYDAEVNRAVLLKGAGLRDLSDQLLALAALGGLLFTIVVTRFRKTLG